MIRAMNTPWNRNMSRPNINHIGEEDIIEVGYSFCDCSTIWRDRER